MTGTVKKFLICLFICFALLITGLFGAAYFISKKLSDASFIKTIVKKEIGLDLDILKPKSKVSGLGILISASDISLKDNKEKTPYINIKDFKIKVKILPVLLGKITIDTLSAQNLTLNLKRLEDGSIDLLDYFKSKNGKFKVDMSHLKGNIEDYNIHLTDYQAKNSFSVDGFLLQSQGLNLNGKFALKTEGIITTSRGKTPYLIDLDFTRRNGVLNLKKQDILIPSFDISFFKSYFKDNLGFEKLNGRLDICSEKTDGKSFNLTLYLDKLDIAFNYKGDKNTIYSKQPVIAILDFNFSNKDLIIENGSLVGENINIKVAGKIKNALALKNIEINTKLTISDTYLANLLTLSPDTLFPMQEPYVKNLKAYKANALINGEGNLRYKNSEDFDVTGKLLFDDVYILKRPLNAETSFGECEFSGREVSIKVYANAPDNASVIVIGKTRMQKLPPGEYYIKSQGKVDLEFAQSILNPLQQILSLKMGPLPYMTVKGKGEIELKTKGTKIKSKLNGWVKSDNASVSLKDLNAVLVDGKVNILFKDEDIIFDGAKGKINGSDININGHANVLGDIDLTADVKNIPAKYALNVAQTSPLVTVPLDGGAFLRSFKPESGNVDFKLKLSGNIPPDAVFGQPSDKVTTEGKITFKGVNLTINPNIKARELKGDLNFKTGADFNLSANIFDSPFTIKGEIKQKGAKGRIIHGVPSVADISLNSKNLSSKAIGTFISDNINMFIPESRMFAVNLSKIFKTNNFQVSANVKAKGEVMPNANVLDLSGFNFDGRIDGKNSNKSDFIFKNGNITLKGKDVKFNNLKILASGVDFLIDGSVNKFASKKPHNNLNIVFYDSPVECYANILKKAVGVKKGNIFANFGNYKGKISGRIKLNNTKIDGQFIPKNISLEDTKKGINIVLKDGIIKLKDNKTYLHSINVLYDTLPVLIDGFLENNNSINPELNIYLSSILSEENCDKLVNTNLQYPISITGEAIVKGRVLGTLNNYTAYLNLILNEGNDLSFMGLKLGDENKKREISSKIRLSGNLANIDYIKYSKKSEKQNLEDIIKICGKIKISNKDIIFQNLKLQTINPAPIRFLNPLFKKSIMKEGTFSSNITLNGTFENLNAYGDAEISNVLIPMYDSIIDNIKITLNKDKGTAKFKLKISGIETDATVDFANKTTLPFTIDNISLHVNTIDFNKLSKKDNTTSSSTKESSTAKAENKSSVFNPSDIVIKKGNIHVDKIVFNGVEGENLKINLSNVKNGEIKINDSYLSIAGGLIKGNGVYKFNKNDITLTSDFMNCEANLLLTAFLNVPDEIYGNANGKLKLSVQDFNADDYLKKIKAEGNFEIIEGRMPKLGSIEYLLKASNFFKSGLLNLSINNVFDLLTPYKHGDFNKISGSIQISDAKINNLQIYSQGENLSTYTHGTYDISTGYAVIEILGKLSKKVSSLLGPVGNASVVSVLNAVTKNKINELVKTETMKNIQKIPFLDLTNDEFRLFNAKIKGQITTDDVSKSFTWLN